jgi:hypothetical protein
LRAGGTIRARAPLDHVNNLGWTAVIESIVLGDGGPRHTATLKALVDAGADVNLADRSGTAPTRSHGDAATPRWLPFSKSLESSRVYACAGAVFSGTVNAKVEPLPT